MKVSLDSDFGLILNCAVRYACGRRTYITSFVCNYIKPLIPHIDTKSLINIVNSIDFQVAYSFSDIPLGDKCDEEAWLELKRLCKEELSKTERSKPLS